ncbi:MAG TPA: DUF6794 domain-containing protein [Gemmataceae bacterium]|jgi:hypothetical protein
MELMPESEWPRTVEAAVARMLSALTAEQRELVRETAFPDLIRFHDNLGRWIRNQFGLWRGNKELMEACGLPHPDDCSMVIIEACWRRLRSELERSE